MKVASIHLQDFKRFENLEIKLRNSLTGDIADRFLLLGDNGTGKTTVLQAIALCLSLASWRTRSVRDFHWLGWVSGRYERWGRPVVELEVHFSQEEIDATREAASRWFRSRSTGEGSPNYVEPGDSKVVSLRLDGEYYSAGSQAELYQFRGRWYAAQLLETDPAARNLFEHLPGVFWFDQFRNLATPPSMSEGNGEPEGPGRLTYQIGVARLREHLNRWQLNRLTRGPARVDFLDQLQKSYKRVFPDRSFSMPEPMYRGGVPSPNRYLVPDDRDFFAVYLPLPGPVTVPFK